jgi:transposase-like protein
MAVTDRNRPKRQASSESAFSLLEFMREYPDDAACLDRLWRDRFAPDGHHAQCTRCERERKFHRTKTRASYTCDTCGLHVHPMKGTIFEKSTTSLHQWFYAMYLMASTRCGISAKQLERELGVGYKTAHRMMKKIRTELMRDLHEETLRVDVEIDETSWDGKPRQPIDRFEAAAWREAEPAVVGMVDRGGRARARVIASRRDAPLARQGRACCEA